mgnify:CR=1 FL=1
MAEGESGSAEKPARGAGLELRLERGLRDRLDERRLHGVQPVPSLPVAHDERVVAHPQSRVAPFVGVGGGSTPVLTQEQREEMQAQYKAEIDSRQSQLQVYMERSEVHPNLRRGAIIPDENL